VRSWDLTRVHLQKKHYSYRDAAGHFFRVDIKQTELSLRDDGAAKSLKTAYSKYIVKLGGKKE